MTTELPDELKEMFYGRLAEILDSMENSVIWSNDGSIGDALDLGNKERASTFLEYLRLLGRKLKGLEDRGVEPVNNFELVAKLYLTYLTRLNVPMPYTMHVGKHMPFLQRIKAVRSVTKAAKHNTEKYPPLLVRKPMTGHCGKGIEVFIPSIKNSLLAQHSSIDDIYQDFIYPPTDIFEDGYLRDTRVVLVNGEPSAWYSRKAQEPLLDNNGELIEFPPSLPRVLTNVVQGGKLESLPDELKDRSLDFVREVYRAVLSFGNYYRREIVGSDKDDARCGFCSIDMLYDQNGDPLLLEVDLYPDLNAYPRLDMLAYRFAKYMRELSGKRKKPVYIFDLGKNADLSFALKDRLIQMNVPATVGTLDLDSLKKDDTYSP